MSSEFRPFKKVVSLAFQWKKYVWLPFHIEAKNRKSVMKYSNGYSKLPSLVPGVFCRDVPRRVCLGLLEINGKSKVAE